MIAHWKILGSLVLATSGTAFGQLSGTGSGALSNESDVVRAEENAQSPSSSAPVPAPVRHVLGDYDGDNLRDIFLVDARGNRLFHNLGEGELEDVTAWAFPDGAGAGGTAVWGDVDGDGAEDLLIADAKGTRLYRNGGALGFEDITANAGLPTEPSSHTPTLEDFDGDGRKDIIIRLETGDRIYRNRGGGGFAPLTLPGFTAPLSPKTAANPGAGPGSVKRPPADDSGPSTQSPSATAGPPGMGSLTSQSSVDARYLNDNSPNSVGIGVPEVEGGDDGSTSNDIVDGTITNSDISASAAIAGTKVEANFGSQEVLAKGAFRVLNAANEIRAFMNLNPGSDAGYFNIKDTNTNVIAGFGGDETGGICFTTVNGVSKVWLDAGGDSYLTGGKLGVGTTSPDVQLHVEGGTDTDVSGGGFLVNGSVAGLNLSIDNNEIMARNNGAVSELFLNANGGAVTVGSGGLSASSDSTSQTLPAVRGEVTATSGDPFGVLGVSHSPGGIGTFGGNASTTGSAVGVGGQTFSAAGYGVFSYGNFGATGTKAFMQPHPTDPSRQVRFICLEGNESGTYFRGSSRLKDGLAVIEVPEEFRLVSELDGLTVQLTPVGARGDLWIETESLDRIVVRGDTDVRFHYFVNGVRRGFADLEPIEANTGFVPQFRGVPFGTQYPEAIQQILIDTGILNADLTPNEGTAARLGWDLRDASEQLGYSEKQ